MSACRRRRAGRTSTSNRLRDLSSLFEGAKDFPELAKADAAGIVADPTTLDEQHLREHLRAKLAKSAEAKKIQDALLKKGTAAAQAAIRKSGLLAPAQKIAEGLTGLKERLTDRWLAIPHLYPNRVEQGRSGTQQPPSTNVGLDETIRGVLPVCCVDQSRAGGKFRQPEHRRRSAEAGSADHLRKGRRR